MQIDIRSILLLTTIPGIGPGRLRALVSHFKDPRAVQSATAKELVAVEGIERKTAHSIANFFRHSGAAQNKRFVDDQLNRLNKSNGRVVTFWDEEYPENLRKIYDPPPFLFVRGRFADEDKYSIAIVGTRSPSPYGEHMAERFSTELAKLGIAVVSGLARGIDTIAHTSTLKARGRTIGIIGSGIDVIYPPENKALFERIPADGAVVSEYLMGAKPDAGNFPRRNRLISGITIATIIVETDPGGGAMITAATALEQNRDVFAIPSAVSDKRTSGTNLLIKQGKAVLLESIDDILVELSARLKHILNTGKKRKEPSLPPLSLFEQRIYDAMNDDPIHIDALAERSALSTSDALVHLLSLEFKGAVKQRPGKIFVRTQ